MQLYVLCPSPRTSNPNPSTPAPWPLCPRRTVHGREGRRADHRRAAALPRVSGASCGAGLLHPGARTPASRV